MSVLLLAGSLGGFGMDSFPDDLIPQATTVWKGLHRSAPTAEDKYKSRYHNPRRQGAKPTISADVVTAAAMLADPALISRFRPLSGVVRLTDNCYVSEYHHYDGSVSFGMYDISSGQILALKGQGDTTTNGPGLVKTSFPTISDRRKQNLVPLILPLLAAMRETTSEINADIDIIGANMYSDPGNDDCIAAMYRLSDAVYFGLNDRYVPLSLTTDGVIGKPPELQLFSGNYDVNEVVCGYPQLLFEPVNGATQPSKAAGQNTIEAWRNNPDVQAYIAAQGKWTDEEREWIPQFPNDTPVTPEVGELVMAHVLGQKYKRPVVNMAWRGTSGHGKSTGVEMLAAILDKPLLRLTCYSTMETEKFLTAIMPDTSSGAAVTPVTFEEISCDPEGAYEKLTGKYVEGIDYETVFSEAIIRMASLSNSTPRYVMQESTYVRALVHGYIIEVQESSRIRDAGVLPGLNEYDRPGAMIPMVDGSFRKRHPLALCIFTDNVGYNSCNELDPSVIRRIAYIIDSDEIGKDEMVSRIMRNTGVADKRLVKKMYDVWKKILDYCKDNDLLSAGGCVTIEELERWVQFTDMCGLDKISSMCVRCVVSKATTDYDEQKNIITGVMEPEISQLKRALGA